jgi:PAS domain S-box-containing protein
MQQDAKNASCLGEQDEAGVVDSRNCYEQAPDIILFLEPETGTVLEANPAVHAVLGYAPESLVGRSVLTLAHPDTPEGGRDAWKALACCSELKDADIQIICKDGGEVEASASATTIRDHRGRAVSGLTIWRDISKRRQSERLMLADHDQLRVLAYELTVAEERERKRIASGLHDEIGQVLAIAKLKLGELGQLPVGSSGHALIENVRALVDEAARATRTATFDLSSPVLYQLGLEAAIESLGTRMEKPNGLRFQLDSDGRTPPFSEETLAVLFRVVRELLFNIYKHARARNARVRMQRTDEYLLIRVEDDGVGFQPVEASARFSPHGGFGLFSITAQMQGIGGRMDIHSALGGGTRVEITVPVATTATTALAQVI